jgi:hypothetical protein
LRWRDLTPQSQAPGQQVLAWRDELRPALLQTTPGTRPCTRRSRKSCRVVPYCYLDERLTNNVGIEPFGQAQPEVQVLARGQTLIKPAGHLERAPERSNTSSYRSTHRRSVKIGMTPFAVQGTR